MQKRTLFKLLVGGLTAFILQACGASGLLPSEENGAAVSIPRVIVNCQSSRCRANATAPLISTLITRSSCSGAYFGALLSSVTRSISCTSLSGCYGDVSGWQTSTSSASTVNEGTYNICTCILFSGAGVPWTGSCDTIGSKENVTFSSSTGLQTINIWADQ